MKILIISEHYYPMIGGSITYVDRLCKSLVKIGCDVYLVTRPDNSHKNENWYNERGVNIFHLNIPKALQKERYFPIFLYGKINYLIKYIKPDIIHIGYGFFVPLITRFNKNMKFSPLLWTVHNVPPKEHKFDFLIRIPILNNFLKQIYFKIGDIYSGAIFKIAKYDIIICSSQKTADLVATKGVANEKIRIIPVGIDTDIDNPDLDISEIKKQLKFQNYKNIILTVAGIIPHKGQKFLLRAIPNILQRYPHTLFLIVGPIRSELYYTELTRLIKKLNIEQNVRIIPKVTDAELYIYYQIADIYVQPSLEEGFCISILEAMSYEKPVIGTKTGAIPNFINESGGGILIEPSSSDQLCNAILHLLYNPAIMKTTGEKAREYTLNNYTWEKIARRTLNLYEKVTNENNATARHL